MLTTMQRMICGKDDAVLTHVTGTVCIHVNLFGIRGASVVSFTTVNVHHMQIRITVVRINHLHKFAAQLFCQQNTGSYNNCCGAVVNNIMTTLSVNNHRQSFATTSGNNHLTFVVKTKTFDDAFLMWTKGDHVCSVDVNSIKHRETPRRPSVPLV